MRTGWSFGNTFLVLVALTRLVLVGTEARSEVAIKLDDGMVRVDARDASARELMAALATAGNITVNWDDSEPTLTLTAKFSGQIDQVIGQVLDGRSFVIEYQSDAPLGVASVTVLGRNAQPEAQQAAGRPGPVAPSRATAKPNLDPRPLPPVQAADVAP